MSLYEKILELQKRTYGVSANPILDAIDLEDCKKIDELAKEDNFIKEKKELILENAEDLDIDFDPKYTSIYGVYSEVRLYIHLKEKYQIQGVKKIKGKKTPDFKIQFEEKEIYLELKSLSFSDGNLKYKKAQEDALNATAKVEESLKKGSKIAFATYSTRPLGKSDKYISDHSVKHPIEEIISKIEQNIKEDQYGKGDTILAVNIKQLIIPSDLKKSSAAFFIRDCSVVSGVLWNVAFGQIGNLILDTKGIIEGQLERNGILREHDYIKGLVFTGAKGQYQHKLFGFFRDKDEFKTTTKFIDDSCCFVNNELNFCGFKVIESQ